MIQLLGKNFMCKKLLVFLASFCLGVVFIQLVKQTNKTSQQPIVLIETVPDNSQSIQPINPVKVFFEKFQKAAAENDKATVVSLINFPIKVVLIIEGKKLAVKIIKSADEFLLNYDKIFDDSFKESISQTKSEFFWYSTSCEVSSLRSGIKIKIFGIGDIMEIYKRKDLDIKITELDRESYLDKKKRNDANKTNQK